MCNMCNAWGLRVLVWSVALSCPNKPPGVCIPLFHLVLPNKPPGVYFPHNTCRAVNPLLYLSPLPAKQGKTTGQKKTGKAPGSKKRKQKTVSGGKGSGGKGSKKQTSTTTAPKQKPTGSVEEVVPETPADSVDQGKDEEGPEAYTYLKHDRTKGTKSEVLADFERLWAGGHLIHSPGCAGKPAVESTFEGTTGWVKSQALNAFIVRLVEEWTQTMVCQECNEWTPEWLCVYSYWIMHQATKDQTLGKNVRIINYLCPSSHVPLPIPPFPTCLYQSPPSPPR